MGRIRHDALIKHGGNINATDVLHLTTGTLFRLILCGIYSASNANGSNGKQASTLTGAENEAGKSAMVSKRPERTESPARSRMTTRKILAFGELCATGRIMHLTFSVGRNDVASVPSRRRPSNTRIRAPESHTNRHGESASSGKSPRSTAPSLRTAGA